MDWQTPGDLHTPKGETEFSGWDRQMALVMHVAAHNEPTDMHAIWPLLETLLALVNALFHAWRWRQLCPAQKETIGLCVNLYLRCFRSYLSQIVYALLPCGILNSNWISELQKIANSLPKGLKLHHTRHKKKQVMADWQNESLTPSMKLVLCHYLPGPAFLAPDV